MNAPYKKPFLVLFLLSTCFITVNAQRGRGGDRGQRGNSYSSREGGSFSNRNNGEWNRGNNNSFFDRRMNDNRVSDRNATGRDNSMFRRNNTPTVNDNRTIARNTVLGMQPSAGLNPQRINTRTVVLNSNVRVNSYNRYPGVYSYDRYGGYSFVHYNNYAPRRYVYVGAPRYTVIPRSFLSINFGGYPYWYDRGSFYGYTNGFYEPVFAPIGIRVSILPAGYYPIYVGPSLYFYFGGTYYRRSHDRNDEYEVVDAPVGAVVTSLPKGATKVVLNGEKFYEFNGIYYKEGANSKNEIVYTVVGKNGVINNTDEQPVTSAPQTPQVGDAITTLPENSRQVTINGDVLYVTPDNLYLKAETVNNTTTYKVVGKAEKN